MSPNESLRQSVVNVPDKVQDKPKMTIKSWFAKHWPGILGELFSATLLVLFGCMSSIPVPGSGERSVIYTSLSFGCIAMIIVQIFGHVSGAYMNPVITTVAVIWGSISIPTGIAYAVMQVTGALIGYGILINLSPLSMTEGAICLTQPHEDLTGLQAIGIEIVITAALGFLCCSVWDRRNEALQDSAPIKFGLTIIGVSLAAGPLTGASLNPARSFAPAVWTGVWTSHYVYWVGPFIGGISSVLIYKFIFDERPENH